MRYAGNDGGSFETAVPIDSGLCVARPQKFPYVIAGSRR